jgi:hypothetical protein
MTSSQPLTTAPSSTETFQQHRGQLSGIVIASDLQARTDNRNCAQIIKLSICEEAEEEIRSFIRTLPECASHDITWPILQDNIATFVSTSNTHEDFSPIYDNTSLPGPNDELGILNATAIQVGTLVNIQYTADLWRVRSTYSNIDRDFSGLLNRLRSHQLTEADIELLMNPTTPLHEEQVIEYQTRGIPHVHTTPSHEEQVIEDQGRGAPHIHLHASCGSPAFQDVVEQWGCTLNLNSVVKLRRTENAMD